MGFFKKKIYLCVWVFCLPVGLCTMCMLGAHGSQERVSDAPGTGVMGGCCKLPLGAWNPARSSGTAASSRDWWAITTAPWWDFYTRSLPTSFLLWGKRDVMQRSLEIKAGKVRESPELLPGASNRHLHSTSYWQCEGVHTSPPLPSWHCSGRLVWGVQFPCTVLSLLCLLKKW